MGKTALYRDPIPWRPARAEPQLDPDALVLAMPDGRRRRHAFDGATVAAIDGFVAARSDVALDGGPPWARARVPQVRIERRFVRMLVIERPSGDRAVLITPPDQGAVAPNVVRVPEAPSDAAIVDARAWAPIADWVLGGGRLSAFSIAELAHLAQVASSSFAVVIGEVAAQRALELAAVRAGPLRVAAPAAGEAGVHASLAPLVEAAKQSPRAAEALVSALAYVAGAFRPRLRHHRHT